MRIIFAFIMLIGIGLAGYAAYLTQQKFTQFENELAVAKNANVPQIELVEVAVASKSLSFGQFLHPADVKMIKWPKGNVPLGAFRSLEAIVGEEGTEPRAILVSMVRDEPILPHKVTKFGQDAGVRSRLAPGMRAFTININVSTGVSGFLQPNDHVDVYWSGESRGETVTRLLLEGVRLIAVDQVESSDISRTIIARTVTVEVSPQIVAELTQAQQTGRLTLSLRGAEDTELSGGLEVNQSDIIGAAEAAAEAKPVCTLRTRKGAEVVVVEVPCPTE